MNPKIDLIFSVLVFACGLMLLLTSLYIGNIASIIFWALIFAGTCALLFFYMKEYEKDSKEYKRNKQIKTDCHE